MTDFDYPEPVSQLLTLGDCRGMHQWPDFLALGIGPEHVPDLIRIVEDEELNGADSDSLEIWAPVHAWRDLGQLRAEAAIEPLIEILWRIDDEDEWVGEEVPTVLGMIGPAAVPKLTEYLADPGNGLWPRVAAAQALVEIGQRHPEAWADCVAVLTRNLEGFPSHEQTLNAFLISFLVDLKAPGRLGGRTDPVRLVDRETNLCPSIYLAAWALVTRSLAAGSNPTQATANADA